MKAYPVLKQIPHTEEWFGKKLEDPYAWIRDQNHPDVQKWVREENAYTDAWFDPAEVKKKEVELKAEHDRSLYLHLSQGKENGTYLVSVQENGGYMIKEVSADFQKETIIMKQNDIPGFSVFDYTLCPCDHNLAAIEGSFANDPRLTVLVRDQRNQKILFQFEQVFGYAWSKSSPTIYYAPTNIDPKTQKSVTHVHAFHADTRSDETLLTDSAIIGAVHASMTKGILYFEMMDDYSSSRFFRYSENDKTLTCVNEKSGPYTYVDTLEKNDYFISREKADFGEILKVPVGKTLPEAQVFQPETDSVLEFTFADDGRLYLGYMDHVCSRLIELDMSGRRREITLPERMGTLSICGTAYERTFLNFTSFLDKGTMLKLENGILQPVLHIGTQTYPDLIVEQKYAPSIGDHKKIPYFIVRQKEAVPDVETPLWMYAYGGYNVAMRPQPYEDVSGMCIADWVQKGRIFVLGSIRGGSEFGSSWHKEGMAMNKRKCYEDFIGIVEQLMKDGRTSPSRLVISGMSNGGLLMSALVTMRPDLFGCVIDSVPHTDMIHFTDDDRGPMYITEYGNPKESEAMFSYLLSYSPYHHIRAVNYPYVFIQTGECDNNVPPYHGKKFAAKMQQMNRSENPILLRVLYDGAHNRGTGDVYWRTVAEMLVFVEKALKLQETD